MKTVPKAYVGIGHFVDLSTGYCAKTDVSEETLRATGNRGWTS